MDIENTSSCVASSTNQFSQLSEQQKPLNVDYKIISRNNSRTSSGGSNESLASMSTCLLQELSQSVQNGSVIAPDFIAKILQLPQKLKIPIIVGEIPIGIDCFQSWKHVVGYERKFDGEMYEFSLQDMENDRLTFQESLLYFQNNKLFQYPALQVFISKFQQIHEKRQAKRMQGKKSYKKISVFHEFINDFKKKFISKTDKVIKQLIDNTEGYLVTLRCHQNIETNQHELYKIGFSRQLISLLGVDPEQICYDFMNNGLHQLIDEESLLNLSSVLICYHMTNSLQERKVINMNLLTYDNLILSTKCSIQFHGEKMDKQNSYFESIVTLSIVPDKQSLMAANIIRQNMKNQLNQNTLNDKQSQSTGQTQLLNKSQQQKQQQQTKQNNCEEQKPFLTTINNESTQNNQIFLKKFYGYTFGNKDTSPKTCKIKYI